MSDNLVQWQPDPPVAAKTQITEFARWVKSRYNEDFDDLDYPQLHAWSVADIARFWGAVATFFDVKFHSPPTAVVQNDGDISAAQWFVDSTINYAEHALGLGDGRGDYDVALIFEREDGHSRTLTYGELRGEVAAARTGLVSRGVGTGDRVVALAPNCIETVVLFLAAASIGAIWASCSPDFGRRAAQERFAQLDPSVLLVVDGYRYGGKTFDLLERNAELQAALPTLRETVFLPYIDTESAMADSTSWSEFTTESAPLEFTPVPFDHPLWVLYSSGTTGLPKGIVHGHGGIVLEHLKVQRLMTDQNPGDRGFWFTTTGWMMWNYLLGSLLAGGTAVLYDGNPAFPDNARLWDLASKHRISFFGVSAPYLHAAMKAGVRPDEGRDLSSMRMIGATGAPLSPAGFRWIADSVGSSVQIYSNSGGTDVCTPFVMSVPTVPVWTGEISVAALGCAVEAFGPDGHPVIDDVGELVVTTPMPSMPVKFWNDPDRRRLKSSYFEDFPNVWRHGDWVKKTPRNSYIIYGRSDSTLNRGGVRLGTAEFYSLVEDFGEVRDSLVIDMTPVDATTNSSLLCFLVLAPGISLESIAPRIKQALREELSPRHVPDRLFAVADVPRTLNGKKCEVPVKRILLGMDIDQAVSRSAMQNPESLDEFVVLRDSGQLSTSPQN